MRDRDILQQLSKPDLWKIVEHHADKLGIEFEVALNAADVSANPVDKVIRGCPVRGTMTLAAMLHEIGHIAVVGKEKREHYSYLASKGGRNFDLKEERLAWTWAKHNCPTWDGDMTVHAKKALSTHVDGDLALANRMLQAMKQELGSEVCRKLAENARQPTIIDQISGWMTW